MLTFTLCGLALIMFLIGTFVWLETEEQIAMEAIFIVACLALICIYIAYLTLRGDAPIEYSVTEEDCSVYEWTDSTTGVTYFINTAGGIYPKLNVDGSLYIKEKEDK